MRALPEASPDHIDLMQILSAVKRNGRVLVLGAVTAAALTFAGLSLVAPRYTSEAQIAITARSGVNPFAEPGRDSTGGDTVAVRMDREAVNTHVKALTSPDLAARVMNEIGLARLPEFNAALPQPGLLARLPLIGQQRPRAGESEEDRVLSAYFKALEVSAAKESRSISIRFTSQDRDLAAQLANRLAEAYRASLAQRTIRESDDVSRALEPKIVRLREELTAAETEVDRARARANLFKGAREAGSLDDQKLTELATAETKAKTDQTDAEARARAARDMLARGSAEVHPDVQRSPVVQKLVQDRARLESEIAQRSAQLLPAHPAMRQLKAERSGLDVQIKGEVAKVVDSLDKEARAAGQRVAALQKSLADLKTRLVDTGADQARIAQLEANAKSKRAELERLQAQYESNRVRAEARTVPIEAQIIASARPAGEAAFPRKGPLAGLVGAAWLLFGAALVIARELMSSARSGGATAPIVATGDEAVASPELPGAASAAVTGPGAETTTRKLVQVADTLAATAKPGAACRTLVVGAGTGVDPSAEALEIAERLAAGGNAVLLVDWSLDGVGIAEAAGRSAAPGLAELLAGTAGFIDVIARVPGGKAHLIGCGKGLADTQRRLDPNHINLILDTLDEAYAHVLVVGTYRAARGLFETTEGRFDAGVLVCDDQQKSSAIKDAPDTFLGFQVADLTILRFARGRRTKPAAVAAVKAAAARAAA